ncbi:MAG: hypothetical protein AAF203_10470, partial [Pseudomonadota bacterium]
LKTRNGGRGLVDGYKVFFAGMSTIAGDGTLRTLLRINQAVIGPVRPPFESRERTQEIGPVHRVGISSHSALGPIPKRGARTCRSLF